MNSLSLKNSSNSLDALLALRALACFVVVLIHCAPPRESLVWNGNDRTWMLFGNAWVAVWAFFCLSGYLMGKVFYSGRYTLSRSGIIRFFQNRALEIFPLYYFSVFILTIFVYPELLKAENLKLAVNILTFTYSPFLTSEGFNYNISIWLLSTEVQFYLIVPLIYALIRRICKKLGESLLALFLVIGAMLSLKFWIYLGIKTEIHNSIYAAGKFWYTPMVANLDIFLVGFLMNPILVNLRKIYHRLLNKGISSSSFSLTHLQILKILSVVLLCMLYLLTAHNFYYQELWGIPNRGAIGIRSKLTLFLFQPLTALVVAFFILAFEIDDSQPNRVRVSYTAICRNPLRILEIFGNLSYGIYIWHYPIIQKITFLFSNLGALDSFLMRFLGAYTLASLLATITYYLVELPASRHRLTFLGA